MMLDQKARNETELLRRDGEVEIVAKPLPALWTEISAIGLRRREQTEFHQSVSSLPRVEVLESRQVGKCHASGMDVHAAEFGAAVQGRKHLAGIEQAFVIEGTFEPLLLIEIGLRKHRRHQVALLDADAVLTGQDAADFHA